MAATQLRRANARASASTELRPVADHKELMGDELAQKSFVARFVSGADSSLHINARNAPLEQQQDEVASEALSSDYKQLVFALALRCLDFIHDPNQL